MSESESGKATVKGLVFRGAKRWFEENQSADTFEQFLVCLPETDRDAWENGMFFATSRYSAQMYRNMYEAFLDMWGSDGRAVFRDAAGAVAFYDLSSVMKIFMKLGSPSFVAGRFPIIYSQYFNVGSYEFVDAEKGAKLTAELKNAEAYGKAGCEGTIGWTTKALTYAGAQELTVTQTECTLEGGNVCRFDYTWR